MTKLLFKSAKFVSAATLSALCAIGVGSAAYSCTSVLAGKAATTDGSVIIARNEDMQTAWTKRFIVQQRATHKKGDMFVSLENKFTYPLPTVTYKYTATPDWDSSSGPFEEDGINEYMLAVSATESASNNSNAKTADPFVKNGITESSIPTILLSMTKTSHEAINLLGKIITEKGAGEAFGLSIADKNEAWYFEAGSGHHWVAVRVPDDSYMVVANQLRIGEVNLSDSKNYMGSKDLITFAQSKGLYDPSKDGNFNFSKVYGKSDSKDLIYNLSRVWWGEKLLTPSADEKQGGTDYPLFLKPDKKISVEDVMSVLRSHYDGSEFDNNNANPSTFLRPISTTTTMESHVLQLRQGLPNEIAGVHWLCLGVPESSVYVPFYSGISDTPKAYQLGNDKYDYQSAYWAFRSVNALVNTNYNLFAPNVIKNWSAFESSELAALPKADSEALALYKKDKEAFSNYITNFCNTNAEAAIKKANEMQSDIISKLTGEPKRIYKIEPSK